ncbi:MAG: maleylacetate reductase [Hyphomicrobiales bacterium]|nr:maleylacetate reductase [Hyphomicrobiales bacterium]
MQPFVYVGAPARVVFGTGTLSQVGAELELLGAKKALVLSTAFQEADANSLAASLGDKCAGIFTKAAMHTPVEVTDEAVAAVKDAGADCTIALGGGSTTGLGKAIAWRTDLPQIVIPTTYAGSEMTPILGETKEGLKTTFKDPKILPEVVIYDVDLTMSLPPALSATSGMNAIAHAIEALYAKDRNPIISLASADGIRALASALPKIMQDPADKEARSDALYGAFLCGMALGAITMALHHKLCHVLGGSFDLPHAETHTVVLPHATAFNEEAVPDLLAPVARALGSQKAGQGLYDLAKTLGAPLRLAEIGMQEDGLARAADIAVANPYWNPRSFTRDEVFAVLDNAFHGRRPE